MRAVQNAPVVTELSRKYDVTGVHSPVMRSLEFYTDFFDFTMLRKKF